MLVLQESVCVPSVLTESQGGFPGLAGFCQGVTRAGGVLGSILAKAQPAAPVRL